MQATEIAPHFEQLTRALGDKMQQLNEDDLRDEFAKYLEYGVPVDQAIRTILRHHGVQASGAPAPAAPTSTEPVKVAELPPQSPYVSLKARFVSLNTKEVNARGETKEIYWGLLGDETGTVAYTSWRPLEGLEKGDAVAIQGAYTKQWNNNVQVNFGDRTQIEKLDPEEVPKPKTTTQEVKIREIKEGMRGLALEGRIIHVAPREITLRTGESKTIWGGKLADETGSIEFTSWTDHGLEEGQAVRIEGAYVRTFRNVPQLNVDDDALISKPEATIPPTEELAHTNETDLATVVAQGGGNDIAIIGTLLEVRPGSGLIFRDPETNRVVHGSAQKDATPDLRIKAVLDDGTGAVNMIVNRQLTQRLLGKDLEQCQEEAREAFRQDVIQEQLQEKLAGRIFRVTGNALSDEYGTMLLVQTIDAYTVDAAVEAGKVLDLLEVE